MEHIVKLLSVTEVTHDVLSFRLSKPAGYEFLPGQATEISINDPEWKDEKRPFTFTGLNEWPWLELTIKIYTDHQGVTQEMARLQQGDELIIRDAWGAIAFNGDGYFIAGGAGITPFIAILRQLHHEKKARQNKLFFFNKTLRDIILKDELTWMLGENVHFMFTREGGSSPSDGRIGHVNEFFLKQEVKDFSKPFYVCGPEKMVNEITSLLAEMGVKAEYLIFEK
ncbi:MAG: oxidoreductase FAD/NAD(P)-binding domain protein [Chitinophagaceae bacterium]|nr:oxidoreductase FAD/NAD(P)-binding domain protein [Chitinophagaceae bacterium]